MLMSERKTGRLLWPLATTALFLALSAGTALAAHQQIPLRDPSGQVINSMTGTDNAFSMRTTCFGGNPDAPGLVTGCHDGSGTGKMSFSVDDIEKHSYHAQLAANEHEGWMSWNPDGSKWQSGPGPKGKNWVQGQGHLGAW